MRVSITRRDVIVAAIAVCGTLGVVTAAQQPAEIMHSTVFDWNTMTDKANDYGSVRSVVRRPTATLDELEMHITTLKAGQTSHAPHKHLNEELIILREGTLETLSQGVWKRVGPGSIIFNASDELHGVKNVGTTPAVYHVVNWRSPGMKKE
jgi:XRE family transcriptional regulator, regulator of sulfur utilization